MAAQACDTPESAALLPGIIAQPPFSTYAACSYELVFCSAVRLLAASGVRRNHYRCRRPARRGMAKPGDLDPTSNRTVAEYLSVLDDATFGVATPAEPKAISSTDAIGLGCSVG